MSAVATLLLFDGLQRQQRHSVQGALDELCIRMHLPCLSMYGADSCCVPTQCQSPSLNTAQNPQCLCIYLMCSWCSFQHGLPRTQPETMARHPSASLHAFCFLAEVQFAPPLTLIGQCSVNPLTAYFSPARNTTRCHPPATSQASVWPSHRFHPTALRCHNAQATGFTRALQPCHCFPCLYCTSILVCFRTAPQPTFYSQGGVCAHVWYSILPLPLAAVEHPWIGSHWVARYACTSVRWISCCPMYGLGCVLISVPWAFAVS